MKPEPYHRTHLSFYDQEWIDKDRKRLAAKQRAGAIRQTQTAQVKRTGANVQREAEELEAQARHEQSLAAKVVDPKVKDLIRNSATGKVEAARALRGKPVDPKESRYELRIEHSQPQR
jgi:hypothetical protein